MARSQDGFRGYDCTTTILYQDVYLLKSNSFKRFPGHELPASVPLQAIYPNTCTSAFCEYCGGSVYKIYSYVQQLFPAYEDQL